MRKAEKIAVCIMVIGVIFKLIDPSEGNILFMIGASLLSLIYFYFSFALMNKVRLRDIFKRTAYEGISTKKILGAVAMGVILSVVIIGIQFKFLILPGAMELLTIGLIFLFFILLFLVIRRYMGKGKSAGYFKELISRALPVFIIGLFFYLITPISLIKIFYRNDTEVIKAWERHLQDSGDSTAFDLKSGDDNSSGH